MTSSPYGNDPQPDSKFGTQPYDPAEVGGPVSEPKRFGLLKNMTIASYVLYALGVIISMAAFTTDGAEDWVREFYSDPQLQMSDEDIEALVDGLGPLMIGMGVIGAIFALALYLIVYIGLAKKKDWARVTGIVFAVIGVVGTVGTLPMYLMLDFFLSSGAGIASVVLFVLYGAASIYWIILAFNSEVRTYLAQFKTKK